METALLVGMVAVLGFLIVKEVVWTFRVRRETKR